MADLWSTTAPRGVGAGHVDDRGHGFGTCATREGDRARAVRVVASMSVSAEECALLLDQLGLDPSEGVVS